MKTFGSNKSQIYYDLFQSLSHGTNAKVQGDQAERLTATTSIVEWHTSSRWSPLKMTATKVRMAHQAVPCRQGGQVKGETLCGCRRARDTRGRSKGKPFVAVAVSQGPRCIGSRCGDHHRCSLEGHVVGRPKLYFGTAHHVRQDRFRKDKVKTL